MLNLIIGNFNCPLDSILKQNSKIFKEQNIKFNSDHIAPLEGLDLYGGLQGLNFDRCVNDIENKILLFPNAQEYVLTGAGLSINILDIISHFKSVNLIVVESKYRDDIVTSQMEIIENGLGFNKEQMIPFHHKINNNIDIIKEKFTGKLEKETDNYKIYTFDIRPL